MGDWITTNKLGSFIGVKASSGFCVYPLYLLYCKKCPLDNTKGLF
ncbi:MAG: DUF4313 domain-containing protein [Bacteroidales bacterium]|nr:DUF4313 domain-containing protein [Bacteroidales bacterium]